MASQDPFRVFVYGTLKTGYWNQPLYLGKAIGVEPAEMLGRLHIRQTSTPILEIPESHRLAVGTADALGDLKVQRRMRPEAGSEGEFVWVRGEVYTLGNPAEEVERLDWLEDFTPDRPGESLYERVLAPLGRVGGLTAWVYVIPPHRTPSDYRPARNPADWDAEVEMGAGELERRWRLARELLQGE